MPRLDRSFSVKLFAILVVVVGGGFGVFGWLTVHKHTQSLMSQILLAADRNADVLQSATRLGMMRNQRADVRQIIQTIGSEPGVDGIRIYNKSGEIIVSTDSTEQYESVDLQAEACVVCHTEGEPLTSPHPGLRHRIVLASDGHRTLGLISPIRNSQGCSEAECHAHSAERKILGVFDVRMSLREIDDALARSRRDLTTWSVVFAVLAAAANGLLVWHFVHRPVRRLARGTREVAAGNLDYRIPIHSRDELGQLADNFNLMTSELALARHELTEWAQTLETRVQQKSEELQRMHEGMAQIDRLASLGRLAATVAHELNNPLSGISTYVSLGLRRLGRTGSDDPAVRETIGEMKLIHEELDRCGKIVKNLLLFSRSAPGEFAPVEVAEITSHCTQLIKHHLKLNDIHLHLDLEEGVTVHGNIQQLRQAFLAILMNAVEAMPDGGELTIVAKSQSMDNMCELAIVDTGRGISQADLPRVFEPFFSSKPDSAGVGLGLSVVYGIVQQHNGRIQIHSTPGKGTRVVMLIPVQATTARAGEQPDTAVAGEL